MIKKVKILKRLPSAIAKTRSLVTKYQTSRAFKVFETFAFLKVITTSGKLQKSFYGATHNFVCYLAHECCLSTNNMYNRLKWLEEWGLIKFDKHGNIELKSWEAVAKEYRVTDSEFHEIIITDSTPKLEYYIKALVMSEDKSRRQYKFNQFVSNNQVKQVLQSMVPEGITTIQQQAEYILKAQQHSFVNRSDSYDLFHSLHADFNSGIRGIKKMFQFIDSRSCVYMKKVLSKLALIKIDKRRIESSVCTRKPTNVFNGSTVPRNYVWDEIKRVRVWVMCDNITVMV